MKIEYEVEKYSDSTLIKCLTKCPHQKGQYVGSELCHMCKWFDRPGYPEENCIICNYKEETVKIEDLKKEVEELKARIAEFEKQGDDWVPQIGQWFWYITNYVSVDSGTWNGFANDKAKLSFHNVYPSHETAQAALPDITRCNAIVNACKRVEPEFVPDWEDEEQFKYYPAYLRGRWVVDFVGSYDRAPSYVSTEENCKRVCELLKEWGVR